MKMLMCGLIASFGVVATDLKAEVELVVDGEKLPLSALMANCESLSGQPQAQVSCYTALSALMKEQVSGVTPTADVGEAFEALRAVAEYDNGDTGLAISGTGCDIQITYFANYFHISRRNVSSIDLHHARFDAAKVQWDQINATAGGQMPISRGVMQDGVTAAVRGGVALESTVHNFSPKSARTTVGEYAGEVVAALPAREAEDFDFVLVHPNLNQSSAEIWRAFEGFVNACQQ